MTEYFESFGKGHSDDTYDSDTVWFDREESKWKCHCPDWREAGTCRHVYWFKEQDTIQVDDGYL